MARGCGLPGRGPRPTPPKRAPCTDLARSLHTTLVVGVTEIGVGDHLPQRDRGLRARGRLVARFEKVHRFPFGEYVPARAFFAHLANLSAVPLDAVPGTAPASSRPRPDRSGPGLLRGLLRQPGPETRPRTGPRSSSSPPTPRPIPTPGPDPGDRRLRIQASQEGRDLLQSSPTGFGAAITNRGTLLERSVLGAPGIVSATLARRDGWTLYVRLGDLGPVTLAVLALVAGWVIAQERSNTRAPRSAVHVWAAYPPHSLGLLVVPRMDVDARMPSAWNMAKLLGSSLKARRGRSVGAELIDAVPFEPGDLGVVPPGPHHQEVPTQPVALEPGQRLGSTLMGRPVNQITCNRGSSSSSTRTSSPMIGSSPQASKKASVARPRSMKCWRQRRRTARRPRRTPRPRPGW